MIAARQIFLGRGAGAKLPYDAEVEYLECTGDGAYIDTGINIDDNDFVLSCDMMSTTAGQSAAWNRYFGSYTSESAASTRIVNYSMNNGQLFCGYRRQSNQQAYIPMAYTTRKTYELSYKRLVVRDGDSSSSFNLTDPSGGVDTSSVAIFGCKMRCFGFHITHSNMLTIDLIPVRKSGIGYMYDRVSGNLLGNAGTGTFVIGPDKS